MALMLALVMCDLNAIRGEAASTPAAPASNSRLVMTAMISPDVEMLTTSHGVLIDAIAGPGVLHGLTGVISSHQGDIGTCSIIENNPEGARIYFEVTTTAWDAMLDD